MQTDALFKRKVKFYDNVSEITAVGFASIQLDTSEVIHHRSSQ